MARRRLLELTVLGFAIFLAAGPLPGPPRIEASDGIQPAIGRLLIARSQLPDPNFFEAVVLLLDYDADEGAFGVVVNRRSTLAVREAVPEEAPLAGRDDPLYLGGPVSMGTMTVLLRGSEPPESARRVFPGVYMIQSHEGLEELMRADPEEGVVRFFAGYAGWARGQLEDEISRGVWHLLPGDPRWIFNEEPTLTWERLLNIIFGPTA